MTIRARPLLAAAGVALLAATVASGVTLAILKLQSRTNPQSVDIRSGVTISEDSAIVQAATRARPAVVSIVTAQAPDVAAGSGYLVTSDGYIVTSIGVLAGSSSMTVLLANDSRPHDARLVDYDCDTAVAVVKIDQVSGLPTLAFGDPSAVVAGQVFVAVAGPLQGNAVTRGIVSAVHRPNSMADPAAPDRTLQLSDTLQTDAVIDPGTGGGPLLNVGGQVVGVAMPGAAGARGYALNSADIQDDVQQIVQTGQVTVPSLGASINDIGAAGVLKQLPEGAQIETLTDGGPAATAGLAIGDIITQLDDVKVDSAHPLSLLLRSQFHVNQRITVTYTRGGASSQVQLTLVGQHPTCA
ncbi:MAG TPA: trypsin-like peptidase domain-containing protein [Candidatus Dormibacteraeota bacterium]|nr:trypsin-like peptidase domain-containing protein [Candidatus Dormibacteraeota bacterium]